MVRLLGQPELDNFHAEDPPFTQFDGWLKCHRPKDLDEAQTIALRASFARFFNEAATSQLIAESIAYTYGGQYEVDVEAPYRYRRFSGGQDLPAGRYYAVCQNELGCDGGTLVAELSSYIDPAASGPVHVCDSSDPLLLALFLQFKQRNPTFYPHAFAVTFLKRRGWAGPDFRKLQESSGLRSGPLIAFSGSPDDHCTIYFPLRVERATIENVIDLRLPHVRRWLADRLFKGLPTARYLYREQYDPREQLRRLAQDELYLDSEAEASAARRESSVDLLRDASSKDSSSEVQERDIFFHPTMPTGAGNKLRLPPEMKEAALLRLITFSAEGGSPVSDAIGEWLREIGANGLIYPSARMNAQVHIEDGKICNFEGFNLVDYRNAPRPRRRLRLIQKPISYIDLDHLRYPISGPPTSEPRLAGSFRINGPAEREARFRSLQENTAWQRHQFGHRPGADREQFVLGVGKDFARPKASVIRLRGFASSGCATLLDNAELIEGGVAGEIGGWLLGYLRQLVGDKDGVLLHWAGEWFCFSARPSVAGTFDFDLLCPICENHTVWSAGKTTIPQECDACGFSQEARASPEELATIYTQSHIKLSA
jgi:hypothetical protein